MIPLSNADFEEKQAKTLIKSYVWCYSPRLSFAADLGAARGNIRDAIHERLRTNVQSPLWSHPKIKPFLYNYTFIMEEIS